MSEILVTVLDRNAEGDSFASIMTLQQAPCFFMLLFLTEGIV